MTDKTQALLHNMTQQRLVAIVQRIVSVNLMDEQRRLIGVIGMHRQACKCGAATGGVIARLPAGHHDEHARAPWMRKPRRPLH